MKSAKAYHRTFMYIVRSLASKMLILFIDGLLDKVISEQDHPVCCVVFPQAVSGLDMDNQDRVAKASSSGISSRLSVFNNAIKESRIVLCASLIHR